MDDFSRIKTFIKVVEAGSFSAAARDASSISSVARQVKSLEDELGIRLLNRSTRSLSLTEVGRRFYDSSKAIASDRLDGPNPIPTTSKISSGTGAVPFRTYRVPAAVDAPDRSQCRRRGRPAGRFDDAGHLGEGKA